MVERGRLVEVQGDGELEGVERANLASEAVTSDEVLGRGIMGVEETSDPTPLAGDIGRESAPQPRRGSTAR